jgi:hypothetical protein
VDTRPGVIRIEPDEQVLAMSRSDLGDLRLVQQGRQIPYLITPETLRREIRPRFKALPSDPKGPGFGRWELVLPVDGLPGHSLSARSPARLFTRRFTVSAEHKDSLGNRWNEEMGSADWVKTRENERDLEIRFSESRLPARLILETDHGDNPPIELEDVLIRYDSPVLMAKVTGEAPVFLCYGNANAAAPTYDLELVRAELLSATPQTAVLAKEEILKPAPARMDSGSPWLWLALAAVVIALLAIVAKLLPQQA